MTSQQLRMLFITRYVWKLYAEYSHKKSAKIDFSFIDNSYIKKLCEPCYIDRTKMADNLVIKTMTSIADGILETVGPGKTDILVFHTVVGSFVEETETEQIGRAHV